MSTWYKAGSWNAVCSSCNIEKDISCFYIHSNGKPRKQCKHCRNISNKKWIKENPEAYTQIYTRGYVTNREKQLEATKAWRKANLEYDAYRRSIYVQQKRKACPSWANLEKIKQIYLSCPKGYHVDHIIPLRGKYVSGLHVENNLQHLPAKENIQKRNKYELVL